MRVSPAPPSVPQLLICTIMASIIMAVVAHTVPAATLPGMSQSQNTPAAGACVRQPQNMCWENHAGRIAISNNATSAGACCSQCRTNPKCVTWAYWQSAQGSPTWMCSLYHNVGTRAPLSNCVSGYVTSHRFPPRPNILFLQCDEMDGRVLDPRSPLSTIAGMPNLGKLAARGVNFVGAYTNSPLCAPSRASMWTGRYVSSIKAWSNVKSLALDLSDKTGSTPDPGCSNFVGYGHQACLALGKAQNVTTHLREAMERAGYDVQLNGKMDTGGGAGLSSSNMGQGGYHGNGAWSTRQAPVALYYPGDSLHSWANGANITRAVFAPLDDPANEWVDNNDPVGSPFLNDWDTVERCVKFLRDYQGGTSSPAFLLYCSVGKSPVTCSGGCVSRRGGGGSRIFFATVMFTLDIAPFAPCSPHCRRSCSAVNPHPPYHSNSSWQSLLNESALQQHLLQTKKTWGTGFAHPADAYSSITEVSTPLNSPDPLSSSLLQSSVM